jgi:hypothetical protein
VVVNIDEPSAADAWLDWAYNKTQGLVVPVFSHNVHELRCGLAVQLRPTECPCCRHRARMRLT